MLPKLKKERVMYINNKKAMLPKLKKERVMTVEKALNALVKKGALIEQVEADKFLVTDNGFFGFCSDEDPFIVDGNGILDIFDDYIGQ